jgi:hypothetical protein
VVERVVHQCQCQICQNPEPHPDQDLHRQINLYLSRLDEQQRRWYVGLQAKQIGHGGTQQMALVTGMHVNTIRRGRRELEARLADQEVGRIRQSGGGRMPVEKKS